MALFLLWFVSLLKDHICVLDAGPQHACWYAAVFPPGVYIAKPLNQPVSLKRSC